MNCNNFQETRSNKIKSFSYLSFVIYLFLEKKKEKIHRNFKFPATRGNNGGKWEKPVKRRRSAGEKSR